MKMFGRVCSVFAVLFLQGTKLTAAYQFETKGHSPKDINTSLIIFRDDGGQSIVFDVNSCDKSTIELNDSQSSETYEISLYSGASDSRISACRTSGCHPMTKEKLDMDFCKDFVSLWIMSSGSSIVVGKGCQVYTTSLMNISLFRAFTIQRATVKSTTAASWRFGESSACGAKETPTQADAPDTTDSGQESTSSQYYYESSTVTAEENKLVNKSETTTLLPKKLGSSAPSGSIAWTWIIISMAVFSLTL